MTLIVAEATGLIQTPEETILKGAVELLRRSNTCPDKALMMTVPLVEAANSDGSSLYPPKALPGINTPFKYNPRDQTNSPP